MRELMPYRCLGRKPNGERCNTLFFKSRGFDGLIEIKCHRCNASNLYGTELPSTSSSVLTTITS